MSNNVSNSGVYSDGQPPKPLTMTCEYQFCNEKQGKDYNDPNRKGAWAGEPVFLCDQHVELLKLK